MNLYVFSLFCWKRQRKKIVTVSTTTSTKDDYEEYDFHPHSTHPFASFLISKFLQRTLQFLLFWTLWAPRPRLFSYRTRCHYHCFHSDSRLHGASIRNNDLHGTTSLLTQNNKVAVKSWKPKYDSPRRLTKPKPSFTN